MPDKPLPPGSVVGILGGGQLGRMLAMAAARLGLRVAIFAPEADSPAFDVAAYRLCAPYDDAAALGAFAHQADAVTLEFENVPVKALERIERRTRVFPSRRALAVTQDRIAEKQFIASLGLPLGAWEPVEGAGGLRDAYARLAATPPHPAADAAALSHEGRGLSRGSFPFQPSPLMGEGGRDSARVRVEPGQDRLPSCSCFLKRARHGYDGKGQMKITGPADLPGAEEWLGEHSAVLEAEVPFIMEMSMLAVRDRRGHVAFYDPPRNTHENGILRESVVPAPVPDAVLRSAEDYARRIAAALDYVGVLAVELFLTREADGTERLAINEIAPRVHNSGHWTTEACAISQFENHIRAVAGWPLGATARHSDARMVNLLGDEVLEWQALIEADPRRAVHLYRKGEARPGRKMGHYVELAPKR